LSLRLDLPPTLKADEIEADDVAGGAKSVEKGATRQSEQSFLALLTKTLNYNTDVLWIFRAQVADATIDPRRLNGICYLVKKPDQNPNC